MHGTTTNFVRLVLCAETAADLMVANPVSIRADATIAETIAWMTDKGFTAAPVIDDAGRPVGVVSRSDVLMHEREHLLGKSEAGRMDCCVADIMTPAVFSISPTAPAARAVEDLLALNVHRLFVVDEGGALVGVIAIEDILRKLVPET
jgi:CBS domain-containing protein